MALLFTLPRVSVLDLAGSVAGRSRLYFFRTGTTTPQPVYADSALEQPLTHPVESSDAGTFPSIYLDDSLPSYKIVCRDANDSDLWTVDPYLTAPSPQQIVDIINPPTQSEIDAGVTIDTAYPVGDVRRYGIVPNLSSARSANSNALRALVSSLSSSTFKGRVDFPNTTGSDTYYFNDIIACRDGIHLSLNGCTLDFSKTAVVGDTNSGFIFAIRDFIIENGTINVDYNMGGVATSAGAPLTFGARENGSVYFTVYDSLLPEPMGNIVVRNMRLVSNTANGNGIMMLGGLQNVEITNVHIDGGSALGAGIQYEYGWATNEGAKSLRQTSHMHNARFTNIIVENLGPTTASQGIRLGAAYSFTIDGLYVKGAKNAVTVDTGESLFYRPWVGVDDAGAKRCAVLRNIVAKGLTGESIVLDGSVDSTGYLSPLTLGPEDETDLVDVLLDGFAIVGGASTGINIAAGKVDIRNGYISGCAGSGIIMTDDCTHFNYENVTILDSGVIGMRFNFSLGVLWSPERVKTGTIRNCFIAGSGTAGTQPAIALNNCDGVIIETCRFGYETAHDAVAETTQSAGVNLGAAAFGVTIRNCYGGGTSGGAVMYTLSGTAGHKRCNIVSPGGVRTTSGPFLINGNAVSADKGDANLTVQPDVDVPTQLFATTLTANRTVTLGTTNVKIGDKFRVVRTGLGAFTLDVGGLKTIPNSTAAFVDVEYNGSAWVLTGYGAL